MERTPTLRPVAAGMLTGLAIVALTVFLRRMVGGPLRDLPATEAAAYTAAFSLIAISSVGPFVSCARPEIIRVGGIAAFVLSLFFAAGLTDAAVAGLTCLLASGAAIVPVTSAMIVTAGRRSADGGCSDLSVVSGMDDENEKPPVDHERAGILKTQMTRCVNGGTEQVTGQLHFEIPPGDIAVTLHVPLWPPMSSEPRISCELEGVEGRVRVSFAKSYGFRIEVRIPELIDEPLDGAVRFVAESDAVSAAA